MENPLLDMRTRRPGGLVGRIVHQGWPSELLDHMIQAPRQRGSPEDLGWGPGPATPRKGYDAVLHHVEKLSRGIVKNYTITK